MPKSRLRLELGHRPRCGAYDTETLPDPLVGSGGVNILATRVQCTPKMKTIFWVPPLYQA